MNSDTPSGSTTGKFAKCSISVSQYDCFFMWRQQRCRPMQSNQCLCFAAKIVKSLLYVYPKFRASRPYFFLILGLRIFFQNMKVGGGKKIKIKITKKNFFFNLKHIWIGEKK